MQWKYVPTCSPHFQLNKCTHSRAVILYRYCSFSLIISLSTTVMTSTLPRLLTGWQQTNLQPSTTPRCPALKDQVSLHIRHHKQYEYECPTLTAEELRQLTTTARRAEIRKNPPSLKFVDDVLSKEVDDHMQRYTAAHEHCKSKL